MSFGPVRAAARQVARGDVQRQLSTAAAAPASASKRTRRFVMLGSVGLSLLSSAPLVYYVKQLVDRPVPAHAAGLKGTWVAATPDGCRWALLKVNAHGMALYQSSDGANFRGPVSYAADSITIEPIVSWFGSPQTLAIGSWPSAPDGADAPAAAASPLVIDGVAFQRAPA